MDLYLDTADRSLAEPLLRTGLFRGLTTNPTILERAGLGVADVADVHAWAAATGVGEIFFQVWGRDVDTLVTRGHELRELGPEVVVKLVASQAGAAACAQLSREGVPTLLTAVYDPAQAVVAAAAGATWIAPYLRRMDAAGRDGLATITRMHEIVRASGTRVLAASVPDAASVAALAERGVDAFTLGPAVAESLLADPLTAEADDTFERAALGDQADRADRA